MSSEQDMADEWAAALEESENAGQAGNINNIVSTTHDKKIIFIIYITTITGYIITRKHF